MPLFGETPGYIGGQTELSIRNFSLLTTSDVKMNGLGCYTTADTIYLQPL